MFSTEFLHQEREWEIARILPEFPPASRILEIGGGTGYQAKRLVDAGHDVCSIDLPSSNYAEQMVYPVTPYDGRTFPVGDGSIDVVFSSNVLEHVINLAGMHAEIRRVLRPGGMCIHLMPTAAWRFWSTATHYPNAVIWSAKTLASIRPGAPDHLPVGRGLVLFAKIVVASTIPHRHGETGNALTELWTFSRRRWLRHFRRHGFEILSARPMGLSYSGNMLLGARMSLRTRERLAPFLGSALVLYKVRPHAHVAR